MKSRSITTEIHQTGSKGRGRPRAFDRGQALGTAMELFWRHGYEGVSITDLTQAMGVSPTSLYAAFGSKAELYREALECYRRGEGGFEERVLGAPGSAREAVAGVLRECAVRFTEPGHPPGCMIASSVLACAEEHRAVARELAAHRQRTAEALAARIRRGAEAGELPSGTDCRALADFYGAVILGMSVQARDGAGERELAAVAEMAADAWEAAVARASGPQPD
jgi:AcrR family transcriptional regulator